MVRALSLVLATASLFGCGSTASGTTTGTTGGGGGVPVCEVDTSAPDLELPDATDPAKGSFTMDQALVDLPDGPGPLRAIIDTDLGALTCELFPDKAPIG